MDDYQAFIETLQADDDYPGGVVATPLREHGKVNFRYAATDTVDQWQAAIAISTSPEEALLTIIEQHERATDRVRINAARDYRQAEQQKLQEAFREQVRTIEDEQQGRLDTKRRAVTARRGAMRAQLSERRNA